MRHARYLSPFVDHVIHSFPHSQSSTSKSTLPPPPNELKIEDPDSDVCVCIAHSAADIAEAKRLVEQRYAWRGYVASGISPGATTPKDRHAVTLLAKAGETTVGTLSVRFDSSAGLNVDEAFQQEVDALRDKSGRLVCELTGLAIERHPNSSAVMSLLVRLAFMTARSWRAATDALIEINPRHERFYRRVLDFDVVSTPRICPRVQAPAVLLHLDICRLEHSIEQISGFGASQVALAA
jgi:hypothetical protein